MQQTATRPLRHCLARPQSLPAACLQMDNSGHRRNIIEMSETANASPNRPVWNAERALGEKRAPKPEPKWEIHLYLNPRRRLKDQTLLGRAIDG